MSPLLSQATVETLLHCPACKASLSPDPELACSNAGCQRLGRPLRRVQGLPLALPQGGSAFSDDEVLSAGGDNVNRRVISGPLLRIFDRVATGRNEVAAGNVRRLISLLLASKGERPRVLLVGGGVVGAGMELLYAEPGVDVLAFDVYASEHVQFIADAHHIPLADGSVDAVVIQAVLDDVLAPDVVVSEIERVLRAPGYVYSEVPFLQPVHDGPRDFFRMTESAHRWLFRNFEALDSGAIGGPGSVAQLSIAQLVRALTGSKVAFALARAGTFWLRALDRFCDPGHARDGAAGTYFLGRRADAPIDEAGALSYYRGGQQHRHRDEGSALA